MKISELSDDQLRAKKASMEAMLIDRQKASRHSKFEKMEFPLAGDAFTSLKNEIDTEISKRNLWL